MDSDPDLPPRDHGGSDDPNPSLDHEPVAAEVEGSSNGEGNQQRGRNGSVPSDLCSGGEIEIEEEEENQEKGFRSPRNSGCCGEGGISEALGGIEEADDGRNSAEIWARWKHRRDEDDASASWRKRKKHFFVLSHSGKPIYSRYGDEHKLAGFSATLHAIISAIEIRGDHVKLIRAGNHQVVFLVKGPIYLVCISCTKEPCADLMGQLELIYGQMLLILTKSIDRCFEKNPNYDMTPLLQGTDPVFSSLVHAFSWNPATFLHAYACLPLPYATRQAAGAILQDAADSGILFAVLMCKHKVWLKF